MLKKQCFLFIALFALCGLIPAVASAKLPNDPFVEQWAYQDIGVYNAWDKTVGSSNVVVAVIDNGFDYLHPDLKDNVWINKDEVSGNGKDDDQNGYIDDIYGWNFYNNNNETRPNPAEISDSEKDEGTHSIIHHGTVVAGIIGAVGDNGLDGAGLNWQVKLMNLKVVGSDGVGNIENLDEAIVYAVDNGADVINISMVSEVVSSTEISQAVAYAYDKGVAIMAAAGNGNVALNYSPMYPVCADAGEKIEKVLGVSSTGKDHRMSIFSNSGSDCIDITAPGEAVSGTLRFSPSNGLNERYGSGWYGTSFATPMVSGAAALIKSIQPAWGAKEIYQALLSTTHHTPGQNEAVYANLFGAGLLQIDKALDYALSQKPPEPDYSVPTNIASKEKILIASAEGVVSIKNIIDNSIVKLNKSVLKDKDDLASYIDKSGKRFLVTAGAPVDGQVRISFYTEEWILANSWRILASGPVEIAVGDLNNDEEVEIVIAPTRKDKNIFQVYNLSGEKIGSYDGKTDHQGVSIDLMHGEKQSSISAFYDNGNGPQVTEFDANFKPSKETPVAFLSSQGVLRIGDVDGDGKFEYVLGAKAGALPLLSFYETDGSLIRSFFAFSPAYSGGFDLELIDTNGDEREETIVLPLVSDKTARIWDQVTKKYQEWVPFDNTVQGNKILVY